MRPHAMLFYAVIGCNRRDGRGDDGLLSVTALLDFIHWMR